ncbi:MAG: DUF4135 domain-containing protein [Oscillospiraceae bacterium]|nr:DUF4135 domain-containing protein [Oscillospiraceae bacterium]
MPNDTLTDILNECTNLNKRTDYAYEKLFAKLPQACHDHPDNIDLFQSPNTIPVPEQFEPRYSRGVLQFLKALDSQLTVPAYMHMIPELTELCYEQKQTGLNKTYYKIFFFEILSYAFNNDQILQILADLNHCFPLVPVKHHGALLKSMCVMVNFPLFSVEQPASFAAVMSRRLHNVADFLIRSHALSSLSNLGLIPSGSDPHMDGQQALFLATDSSQDPTPFLYKPRSMHPDFAVTRALTLANDTALALHAAGSPCSFAPLPVPAVSVNSRMVTFISRCDTFASPQVDLYYTQMGELICLAHFFGITDLHQDNLLPAAEGPQIADAECAFDQTVMNDQNWDATYMDHALFDFAAPEGIANAVFNIDGKGLSIEHFREYAAQILAGYDAALEVCTAMVSTSLPMLQDIVNTIDQIRVVPYSTLLLKEDFYSFFAFNAFLTPQAFTGESDFARATAALQGNCTISGIPTLSIPALCGAMNSSYQNGDLPYFSLRRSPLTKDVPVAQAFLPANTSAGYLYCDYTLVGRCDRFGPQPNFAAALAPLTQCRAQLEQWLTPPKKENVTVKETASPSSADTVSAASGAKKASSKKG